MKALGLRSATPEAMTARARRIGSDAERGRIGDQIADLETVRARLARGEQVVDARGAPVADVIRVVKTWPSGALS